MKDKTSLLFSNYILDGVQAECTPFESLYDCLDGNGTIDVPEGPFSDIVDEYLDKIPHTFEYDPDKAEEYAALLDASARNDKAVNVMYPSVSTIAAINSLLLDCIFKDGHFTLQDMLLMAKWDWQRDRTGAMAAFWESTWAAGNYLFDLGIKMDRYFVESNHWGCTFEVSHVNKISRTRKCPATMSGENDSWLIYIPFGTQKLHLGGSAISEIIGHDGGVEMDLSDADYFMDCYEVVRELVEDGVITAGIPVGRGGLMTAAHKFKGKAGFDMNIAGIMESTGEKDPIKVLFSEMPGVLVEIKDSDYDYVDAQMLLQEISYYPVGHPDTGMSGIHISRDGRFGIGGILASLI